MIIDAHFVQKTRNFELFGVGHGRAGGLFPIAQRGVKNQDAVLFGYICHVWVFLVCFEIHWRAAHPSERARRKGTLRGGIVAAGWHAAWPRRGAAGLGYGRRV